jgi:hypothetical protein
MTNVKIGSKQLIGQNSRTISRGASFSHDLSKSKISYLMGLTPFSGKEHK